MEEKWHKKHWFLSTILLTEVIGILVTVTAQIVQDRKYNWEIYGSDILSAVLSGIFFVGIFFIFPFTCTIVEGIHLYQAGKGTGRKWRTIGWDVMTAGLAVLYEPLYLVLIKQIEPFADWEVQLSNSAKHAAIYTQSMPTLIVVAVLAAIGYFILVFVPLGKLPPLVVVLSLSATYLGIIETVLLAVQVFDRKEEMDIYLWLLPLNGILIVSRIVLEKVREWKNISMEKMKIHSNPFLNLCDKILNRAALWPLLAFLFMFPLLGVLIMILILFGQAPDAVIRAWTETSDWNLSLREAPQNIYYDEHYLCTVAAGGHRKVVKPLRLGIRHGHQVIVNRQLCVANAFEQVLEERTPRFHRKVRDFYDAYGFPVAKLIHSKYTADLIYFLMKPLEWMFLIVLYLVDVKPENRIAVQYMGNKKYLK